MSTLIAPLKSGEITGFVINQPCNLEFHLPSDRSVSPKEGRRSLLPLKQADAGSIGHRDNPEAVADVLAEARNYAERSKTARQTLCCRAV